MQVARIAAPAKINLWLRVLGRRGDGYHAVRTLFQAIDLADEVTVTRGGSGVAVRVSGADVGPERENLAYRAAAAFLEAAGDEVGARVELIKRIPAGAGLGGGSSDAAAVLRCLAALSPAPPDPVELARLGAVLGSDVPFFLCGSPLALAEGRGEVLTPLPPLPVRHLVVSLPRVHVATADAYRALERGPLTRDARSPSNAGDARPEAPADWRDVPERLANDFESVVVARHPEIARSIEALRRAGASGALLSGSGAASFGLFDGRAQAEQAAVTLTRRLGWPFLAVPTLNAMPEVIEGAAGEP